MNETDDFLLNLVYVIAINFTVETDSISKQKQLPDFGLPPQSDHTTCHSGFPFQFQISSFLGVHHLAMKHCLWSFLNDNEFSRSAAYKIEITDGEFVLV